MEHARTRILVIAKASGGRWAIAVVVSDSKPEMLSLNTDVWLQPRPIDAALRLTVTTEANKDTVRTSRKAGARTTGGRS